MAGFTKKHILSLLTDLAGRLYKQGIQGEIGVVGGAALVIAFDARVATKDVDAIFKPSNAIRKSVSAIAREHGLPEDWLNDGVKGFLPGNPKQKVIILDVPGLRVWVPEPEYMLAMKAISARVDTQDADDLKLLIRKLGIKKKDGVFSIIEKYYPSRRVPAKVTFFVEELFEK